MYGIGVPKSCWTAAAYYQQVAEKVSDLSIMSNALPFIERIRLNIQTNHGQKTDRQRDMLQYYQYNADKGNVEAQTAVGQVLNYGTHGVQQDHHQALHYLQRAAGAGDHEAMAHLGHMFANGFGTTQDFVTAHSWFQKASEHGSASAQFGLGYMFLTGIGVAQDHDKAFQLFMKVQQNLLCLAAV
jgi:SEL1 protein